MKKDVRKAFKFCSGKFQIFVSLIYFLLNTENKEGGILFAVSKILIEYCKKYFSDYFFLYRI